MVFICVVDDIDAGIIPAFAIEVEDIVARDTEDVSDAFIREAVAKKLSNGHMISPNALRCTDHIVCTAYANLVYPFRQALRICRSALVMPVSLETGIRLRSGCIPCVPMPPGVTKRGLSMLELPPQKTNPPRRGGPLCPPAQENVTVVFCDDACLAINGLPLARWMHPVRADAAGRYKTGPVDVGIASS